DHSRQMSCTTRSDLHFATSNRSRDQKCTCLDAIRDDGVLRAMKPVHTIDLDDTASVSADVCTHRSKQICQVRHFGLSSCIVENLLSLSKNRRHHEVFCSSHCDAVEKDLGSSQARRPSFHISMFDRNLRPEFFERLDVQVDGSGADSTTAGQRNSSLA